MLYFDIITNHVDPTIDVNITPNSTEQILNVGKAFIIACAARELDVVDPKYVYRWTRDGGYSISDNAVISFSSLNISNAGKYTCEVNISSDNFVGGYVRGMSSYNLSIQSKEMKLLLLLFSLIIILFE